MSHTRARPFARLQSWLKLHTRVCVYVCIRECTRRGLAISARGGKMSDDCRPPGQLDGSSGVLAVNYGGYKTSSGDDSPINRPRDYYSRFVKSWSRESVSLPIHALLLPFAGSGFVPGKDLVAVSAFRPPVELKERWLEGRKRGGRRRPEEELVISGGVGCCYWWNYGAFTYFDMGIVNRILVIIVK